VANLGVLAEPFLPFTAAKINAMLNIAPRRWSKAGGDLLDVGHVLGTPSLLFEKLEDATIEQQLTKLRKKQSDIELAKQPVTPLKAEITYEDFSKLDLRIGKVIAAEKMPKSNKLLKLTIESGLDKRTILSGIAQHYGPDDMVGKQVIFVANLAPRKMMGLESQGMILMAEDAGGKLVLVGPDDEVKPGSTVS